MILDRQLVPIRFHFNLLTNIIPGDELRLPFFLARILEFLYIWKQEKRGDMSLKSSNYVSVAILLAIALAVILVRYVLPKVLSMTLGIIPLFTIVLFCIALIMLAAQFFGRQ